VKPIVFISHSSRDADAMGRLKDLLVVKTSGTVEFFLSSDGTSIATGHNWIEEIFLALSKASVLFAFLSPSSLQSQWMFFEAGLAYNRRIRVIPVGIFGVDIGEIPPPLGLLQGFNIESAIGLNKIIETINAVFSHSHPLSFRQQDFDLYEGKMAVTALDDGAYDFQVLSSTPDGERAHHLVHVEINAPRMTVRSKSWESFGIIDQHRFVGRFKYMRGNSPDELGLHDFLWNGKEFVGSAKLDSGKWFAENLIWRPIEIAQIKKVENNVVSP
jgi:hypothetical protein